MPEQINGFPIRSITDLRVEAWNTPAMTVLVRGGFWKIGANSGLFMGGTSPELTAPTYARYDLVSLDSSGEIQITQGAAGSIFYVPFPDPPDDCKPLAYIRLIAGQTSIAETDIIDVRFSGMDGAPGGFSGFAAPSAEVGAAAISGSAKTAMRSDAAPKLADTAVTPGAYGDEDRIPSFVVDQQGRLMFAATTARLEPLANGDPDSPELVFADGDVVMVEVT